MPAKAPPTDESSLYDLRRGLSPLVIASPHVGIYIPPAIATQMNATGHKVGETDFHVHRLFDFAPILDATTLFATHSRYVIDLNRPPDDASLYPGKFETGLCPLSDFDLHPIYLPGHEPDETGINDRRARYWQPYHDALRAALDAAKARHGHALLIDAHSIRPEIPNLFAGHLPDLNFGTDSGRTLPPRVQDALTHWCDHERRWSHVLDGRFTGGYTTRHYGQPQDDIFALQIEIVQSAYLDLATPHLYEADLASPLSSALRTLVAALLEAL